MSLSASFASESSTRLNRRSSTPTSSSWSVSGEPAAACSAAESRSVLLLEPLDLFEVLDRRRRKPPKLILLLLFERCGEASAGSSGEAGRPASMSPELAAAGGHEGGSMSLRLLLWLSSPPSLFCLAMIELLLLPFIPRSCARLDVPCAKSRARSFFRYAAI